LSFRIAHYEGHDGRYRVCAENGIEHGLTKPHQPDEMAPERMNRTIKEAVRKDLPLLKLRRSEASRAHLRDWD
jgi:hypothetical protein